MIRTLFGRFSKKSGERIILASIPRCGSTYLFRKIAGAPRGDNFPKMPNTHFAVSLEDLPAKELIKTHALAPSSLPPGTKVIFLFGDPFAAIISTLDKRFDRQHFVNCGYTRDDEPDLLESDALGYERIFDSWMSFRGAPLISIRYESLRDHQEEISEFIGRKLELNDFRHRSREIPADLLPQLNHTYGQLKEKIEGVPDFTHRDDTETSSGIG